jgi:outer membrane receptor protein involved in Fe transport
VAIVNTSAVRNEIAVKVRDSSGAQLGTGVISLEPGSHAAVALRNVAGLSAINGKRGYAEFTSALGNFAVLGLRFGGAAFTSIPAFDK